VKKGYWVSLYYKIDNIEKLKLYAKTVTPIIESYGGVPLVRGGKYEIFEGNHFSRTVIWEFPNYEKAIACHYSVEYQKGWEIAKNTTKRHMQVVEGFNTE